MAHTSARGSLSHHNDPHPIDAAKSMDSLFDKVMLGVLILMLVVGLLVYVL